MRNILIVGLTLLLGSWTAWVSWEHHNAPRPVDLARAVELAQGELSKNGLAPDHYDYRVAPEKTGWMIHFRSKGKPETEGDPSVSVERDTGATDIFLPIGEKE